MDSSLLFLKGKANCNRRRRLLELSFLLVSNGKSEFQQEVPPFRSIFICLERKNNSSKRRSLLEFTFLFVLKGKAQQAAPPLLSFLSLDLRKFRITLDGLALGLQSEVKHMYSYCIAFEHVLAACVFAPRA